MKQQQAGIIEAKAAIKRADVSVVQGRSIIVFTVFTIFFVSPDRSPPNGRSQHSKLPLSFFATVFGMNSAELNSGSMPLARQLMYMCMPKPLPAIWRKLTRVKSLPFRRPHTLFSVLRLQRLGPSRPCCPLQARSVVPETLDGAASRL